MPKPPRTFPLDDLSRRRLARRIARVVTWRYRREVRRALGLVGRPAAGEKTMSEPRPNFRLIAQALALKHAAHAERGALDVDQLEADLAEQLRLAWNGRGAVDVLAVDDRLATLTGWVTSAPYRAHLREAIAALDR